MEIYNVGVDELDQYDFERFDAEKYEWLVYAYKSGSYDGDGEVVALRKSDGLLVYGDLAHCSCFGPLDQDWENARTCTAQEYVTMESDYHFDDIPCDEIKAKVRELMGL
jgi:hypothetical protein